MSHFGAPTFLLLLLVVAAMAGALVWLAFWQRRAQDAFAGGQARRWPARTTWLNAFLLVSAATLIAVAAARPQWGTHALTRQRQGVDLVIALDVSQSMQATDASPSRIALAEDQAAGLVQTLPGSRTGLVLFAGSAVLRSPLTSDTTAMSELLRRADKDAGLTNSGSDLGAALDQAGRLLAASQAPGKALLVISDGEDHAGTFADKAAALHGQGVVIYTAGVGTPAGTTLTEIDPRTRQPRLKVDANGQTVITRLDDASLKQIASAGGGTYMHLGDSDSLVSLRDSLAQLAQTPLGVEADRLPLEHYQAFVVAAMILLVESWLLPLRLRLHLPRLRRLPRPRPQAGVVAVLLLGLVLGACGGGPSLSQQNEAANRLYDAGDFQGALDAYQKLLAGRPDVPGLSVNAGNALHRLGSFDRAASETSRALPPTDAAEGERAYYDLGDHLLAGGQYEQAYNAFKSALLLDPNDTDAKFNLELALQALAAQQQQQQQAQQSGAATPTDTPPDSSQPGQPAAPSTPTTPGQATPDPNASSDPTRDLQDALKGIDQNLSFEDAQHILDLLRQQQATQQQTPGSPAGQDY